MARTKQKMIAVDEATHANLQQFSRQIGYLTNKEITMSDTLKLLLNYVQTMLLDYGNPDEVADAVCQLNHDFGK